MSGFDFSNLSGEMFGDINKVFFTKNGKSILPEDNAVVQQPSKVSMQDIAKKVADTTNVATKNANNSPGATVIHISKDVIDGEEDLNVVLTPLEERRRNIAFLKNKHFIDINTGEEVIVTNHTKMYNGTTLITVAQRDGNTITYPRGMFVGRKKKFVPKEFYIREAERAIEDTIFKFKSLIFSLVKNQSLIQETSDGKYLELVLEEPIEILGGIMVPDKVQIPVKRLFDMEYKILILEKVICVDNKIAGLLFVDVWF